MGHYLATWALSCPPARRQFINAVQYVNTKSVLEPATKLVFPGKWLDLLEGMVWSHEVAHLQMLVACLPLAVWRSHKRLMQSFWGFLHWQVQP